MRVNRATVRKDPSPPRLAHYDEEAPMARVERHEELWRAVIAAVFLTAIAWLHYLELVHR